MPHLSNFVIHLYTQGIHVLNEHLSGISYRGVLYILFCLATVLILYPLSKFSRLIQLTLIFVSFVFSTIYMYWRTVYTVEFNTTADVITSILLLSAEYLGYFQQAIFYFLMHRGTNIKDTLILDVEYYPTVDVFVATYNEPVSVLKRTLTACTYLDYPADKVKVYTNCVAVFGSPRCPVDWLRLWIYTSILLGCKRKKRSLILLNYQ
ncbi:hypothetical protein GCM10025859_49820 [Alicyclobacillus fastidiosus]|nr:hypothetical protein GCM10025859_49820 [Alicyclobacillus fastidiosus]